MEQRELQRQRSEAERARAILSRYFSPSVVERLAASDGRLNPDGERREATFLFTDLTGFTHLLESTRPELIVELLNDYIDGMARIRPCGGGMEYVYDYGIGHGGCVMPGTAPTWTAFNDDTPDSCDPEDCIVQWYQCQ